MGPSKAPRVLFLCTGNYYRSRFAERLFAHLGPKQGLDWEAESRGLFQARDPYNVGFMSPHTLSRLEGMGVDPGPRDRFPIRVTEEDLKSATRTIALDESEHRAMLEGQFPDWSERVDYWQVHDLDRATPESALTDIETRVRRLVEALFEVNTGEAGRVRRFSAPL
ncbi:MAG: low molecular weight phosphatase family protein [Myxococcota bacterium]